MTRQPEITPVTLLCLATRQFVDAELWDTISARNLADWESKWRMSISRQASKSAGRRGRGVRRLVDRIGRSFAMGLRALLVPGRFSQAGWFGSLL